MSKNISLRSSFSRLVLGAVSLVFVIRLKPTLGCDIMQDTLLAICSDSIRIITAMGRKDVADILQNRVNTLMGWNNEQRPN